MKADANKYYESDTSITSQNQNEIVGRFTGTGLIPLTRCYFNVGVYPNDETTGVIKGTLRIKFTILVDFGYPRLLDAS